MKANSFYVALDYEAELRKAAESKNDDMDYELLDGSIADISSHRHRESDESLQYPVIGNDWSITDQTRDIMNKHYEQESAPYHLNFRNIPLQTEAIKQSLYKEFEGIPLQNHLQSARVVDSIHNEKQIVNESLINNTSKNLKYTDKRKSFTESYLSGSPKNNTFNSSIIQHDAKKRAMKPIYQWELPSPVSKTSNFYFKTSGERSFSASSLERRKSPKGKNISDSGSRVSITPLGYKRRVKVPFLRKGGGRLASSGNASSKLYLAGPGKKELSLFDINSVAEAEGLYITSQGPYKDPIYDAKPVNKSKWVGKDTFKTAGHAEFYKDKSLPEFISCGIPYESANLDVVSSKIREYDPSKFVSNQSFVTAVPTSGTSVLDKQYSLGTISPNRAHYHSLIKSPR